MVTPGDGYSGSLDARPEDPYRIRYDVLGSNRWKGAAAIAGVSSCSGVTLSRIQNDLPMVDSTRSCRCTLMSVIGVTGRFCWNGCQRAPSSNDTNMPNSVPA